MHVIELSKATYYRWKGTGGRRSPSGGHQPRSNWLLEWERTAIIAYKRAHPELGYRVLCYRMLDEDVVATSPATVYRVLCQAGLSSAWTAVAQTRPSKGFDQPTGPHQQWHTDIAYINVAGTHYFLVSVLDGYSRAIIHHELRLHMETRDVEIVIERTLEKVDPSDRGNLRIITDNGSQFIARDFKVFMRLHKINHSRIRVGYPQSNGKIERWHKTIKNECIRREALTDYEEACAEIDRYVQEYNTKRLHSALGYLTPADYLRGQDHVERRHQERTDKLEAAKQQRKRIHLSMASVA